MIKDILLTEPSDMLCLQEAKIYANFNEELLRTPGHAQEKHNTCK